MKHLPYLAVCAAAAACLGAAAGWPWGLPAGVVLVLAAIGARIATRDRGEIGDDIVTIFCLRCDADPARRCTCVGDCGRRHCKWATLISDKQFRRELAELLEGDSK
jgi:hypothetical protein